MAAGVESDVNNAGADVDADLKDEVVDFQSGIETEVEEEGEGPAAACVAAGALIDRCLPQTPASQYELHEPPFLQCHPCRVRFPCLNYRPTRTVCGSAVSLVELGVDAAAETSEHAADAFVAAGCENLQECR